MRFIRWKTVRVPKQYLKSYRSYLEHIKPFLRLFKFCGIFANEIKQGRFKRCSWHFYGICVFWVIVYVLYICFLLYNFTRKGSIKLRTVIEFGKHLIGYICLIVNVIIAYSSQTLFIKFFDRLEAYDHEVTRMRNGRKDNLWVPWLVVFLMTFICLSFISLIIIENMTDFTLYVALSDTLKATMHICGTVQKFFMLYLILVRFKHLNNIIVPNVSWNERRPNAIKIVDVRSLHSILYDAQKIFGEIYNNFMIIWFASLMIHVLANIHTFRQNTPWLACAFVGPPILQVLLVCAICHYVAKEANNIACILSESMCALIDSGQVMTKINVLTYFLHNRVSFEAAGFFTINLELFQSIVAAITTYIIILI